MAESQLTKDIKARLRDFRPLMPSSQRTLRWAEEVNVITGIVDSIRFEDYVKHEEMKLQCYCDVYSMRKVDKQKWCDRVNGDCNNCLNWNEYNFKTIGMMVTCYEVKISKSDFKSKNGHNFVGNHNYYAVPKELAPKIVELVPDHVGIITCNENMNLRVYKKSVYQEIETSDANVFLYNALKKWCNNSHDIMWGLRLVEDLRSGKLSYRK